MKTRLPALLFSAVALVSPLHAAALMFDFGSTAVSAGDAANSPWHTVEPTGGKTWNRITGADNTAIADVTSGLLNSDGSSAVGVGLNFGVSSTAALQSVNLATQPTRVSALAGIYKTGIYAGTSVGRDAVFLSDSWAIGAQITGLVAGTYDIYITSRNTSYNTNDYKQTAFAGAGTAEQNFDYSSYLSSALLYTTTSTAPSSWVQDETYMKLTVTLATGQALNLAVIGENAGNADRGLLNSVQIVSVPEPSALLISCGMLGALAVCRRRVA